jgi:hypothetical protein
MRMWGIPVENMCNKHLLGEHVEMHMFVGTINKNKNLNGYFKNKLVVISEIKKRHNEIVNEMIKRGMNHKSELPEFKWNSLEMGEINIEENKKELKRRCEECRKKLT